MPDAVPLTVYLLDRCAQGMASETVFDRAVETALAGSPDGRDVAAQPVASYRKIPLAQRQATLGELANISVKDTFSARQLQAAFTSLSKAPPPPPVSLR